ncbi:NADP-dependent alcohol dehydrogenase C 2 [Phytophthora citrophthora]|uniref:NADP-dependent alcohol dehydrogenase C 2 n=1 Tax=Phytophthora citrophthora TaxID=4793 RepID=A0AAD9LS52_9STRA|nr:NADP-dependent alcohol dehydrogenase C 2 [Phytophthora citrophthora]
MSAAPRTIKALACFGKSEPVQPWEYESRPLGAEDVEIKISHCGICGSDLHVIDSGWKPTLYPCVVGHEIVGEVTQAGPDVKDLKVGDRVGVGAQVWACLNKDPKNPCKDCAKGADAYCHGIVGTYNSKYKDGSKSYGGYAEYVRVLSDYAFKIPEAIPSDAAAPLLCAGTTVFTPFKEAGVKAGDRVGIVGIGGLGHLAIQFAKAMGADAVVAFSRSANKETEVCSLGADEFVNYSDPEQAKAAEGSVDVLLVTADADGMPYHLFLSFLASRGTCIMVGLPNDEVHFKPAQVVMKGAKFVGSHIGSIQDVKDMLELAAEKNVRPVVQKLPMSKANEGIQMLRDGKVRYRVVLEN